MKFISLFAGIGGLDLGLERAGFECVAQVEINEFALKVLQKHWASVPKYKDVRDVGKENLPTADLICGGFPCQDVSLIGQRAGLEGKRSTLWSEFYRIVCEIRPRWVVIENVTGLFTSDDGRFFTKILWELSQVGYYAEWDTVPASAFGAPHRRDRVFIVAYSKSGGLQGSGQFEVSPRSSETWIFPQSPRVYLDSRASRWSDESRVSRISNGVPNRVDRIKSTGNAVVPDVAEFIGDCVKKAEARLTQRVPDVWDSARPQALSTPEKLPAQKALSKPSPRR